MKIDMRTVSETCALDVARKHDEGLTHQEIATLMGFRARERVRQLEAQGLRRARIAAELYGYDWEAIVEAWSAAR